MQNEKREKQRLKKKNQRANRSPEKKAADDEKLKEYKQTETGKSNRKIQCKRYRERKLEQKDAILRDQDYNGVVRHYNKIACEGWAKAKKESEALKFKKYAHQIKDQPTPGDKRMVADSYAEVPCALMGLADHLQPYKPEIAVRVIAKNFPIIEEQIRKLDRFEDGGSNFSDQLEALFDLEEQDRQEGKIKVDRDDHMDMLNENKNLKKELADDDQYIIMLKKKIVKLCKQKGHVFKDDRRKFEEKIKKLETRYVWYKTKCKDHYKDWELEKEKNAKAIKAIQERNRYDIEYFVREETLKSVKEQLQQEKDHHAAMQEHYQEIDKLEAKLENKDCCHEAKAENLRLKKDKEELQIENAICTLCGIICTQEQHTRKHQLLHSNKKTLNGFLESLGKRQKQATLRTFLNQESKKNNGDFTDTSKVQSKLSFIDSASTKKSYLDQDNLFITPYKDLKNVDNSFGNDISSQKKAEIPKIESQAQVNEIIPARIKGPVDEVTGSSVEEKGQVAKLTDIELEPDNERNRAYYEKNLDNNSENDPFELSTLNQSFHQKLTQQLDMALKSCRFKNKGTVLELMAGCGRNLELLYDYFSEVEMLERNATMIKAIKKLDKTPQAVYGQDVKDFRWDQRTQTYDCIVCIWGLGYLNREENIRMLAGIKKALKPKGSMIFFESVLPVGETQERFHDTIEQQNVVRSMGYYIEFFTQAGLRVIQEKRYDAWDDGENQSEEYASYLIKPY